MQILKKSDFDADPESLDEVLHYLYGSMAFDIYGRFQISGSDPKALCVLHVNSRPLAEQDQPFFAVNYGDWLGDQFSQDVFVYFEDEAGRMYPAAQCRQVLETHHVYGAIFQTDDGRTWLASAPEEAIASGEELSPDWPVREISPETCLFVREQNGEILNSLPAEGEFTITDEPLPHVASIPWWGEFGSDPQRTDLLAKFKEKAMAQTKPAVSHKDAIETGLRLEDWRLAGQADDFPQSDPKSLDLKLEMRDNRLMIEGPDGQLVALELEAGNLVVFAYNSASDGPAKTIIPVQGEISQDASAYRQELHQDDPSP